MRRKLLINGSSSSKRLQPFDEILIWATKDATLVARQCRSGFIQRLAFRSRSSVRYLFVVLMLTCPNQFATVLRSTPDLRR